MRNCRTFAGALLAASVSAVALVPFAYADATAGAKTTAPAVQQVATASEINLSGVARNAVAGVQYAKLALEQGETDAAKRILSDVNNLFGERDGSVMMKTGVGYALPIDAGLGFAEGFQPNDSHALAFSVAETQMKSGDIDAVISTFTEAGVDIVTQVAVLPYATTVDSVKQAVADLEAGHADKAKTALASIIASVKVESFAPNELPAQGYAMTDILRG